ncbi:MAG: glycosyltransferase [Bacteroidota bacterium]
MSKKKSKVSPVKKVVRHQFKGQLSLVIPCYNESKRVDNMFRVLKDFEKRWTEKLEIIVVDDGSGDDTVKKIKQQAETAFSSETDFQLITLEKNQGKGGALKVGVKQANGDFILTLDADMATRPSELLNWLKKLPQKTFPLDTILLGSREHEASSVKGNPLRRIAGLIFNLLIQLFTNINISDTQCGYKLYPKAIAKDLFAKLKTKGWAHDVELLYQAQLSGIPFQPMPVQWTHQEDSKISLFKDSIRMLGQTILISTRLKWQHFISGPINDLVQRKEATTEPSYYRLLFFLTSVLLLVLMPMLSFDYGITADEEVQKIYGEKILAYFETDGEDQSALSYKNLYYYGGLFDYMAAWLNENIGGLDPYDMRHVLNSLVGFLLILFTGLLAKELTNSWKLAFLALIFTALSPRIFGHSMNNPKDIPFAAAYIFSLLYMIRFMKTLPRPSTKTILMLIIGIAAAINVRVGGILLIAYFGLFTGLTYLWRSDLRSQLTDVKKLTKIAGIVGFVVVASFFAGMIFWPYARQAPLSNPFVALSEMSNFSTSIRMLFEGEHLWSDELPWYYIPKWILISAPFVVLLGLLLALPLFFIRYKKIDPMPFVYMAFTAIFPVGYAVLKGSSLYDGMRHFLFVYPVVTVLAAWGWYQLVQLNNGKIARWGISAVIALLLALPTMWMIRNHPHQVTYFNELSGGIEAAYGRYETDYWMNAMKKMSKWLIENDERIKNGEEITIRTSSSMPVGAYMKRWAPNVKVSYTRYPDRYKHDCDYYMFYSRFVDHDLILKGAWPPGEIVYEEKVDGIPIGAIGRAKDRADYKGYQADQAKDFAEAASWYEKELEKNPKNEAAMLALANSNLSLRRFPQAKAALDQLVELCPDYVNGNYALGVYYMQTQNLDKARETFEKVVDLNYKFSTAYYYLASVNAQQGNAQAALSNIDRFDMEGGKVTAAYDMGIQIAKQTNDRTREAFYTAKKNYFTGNHQQVYPLLKESLSLNPKYEPAVKFNKQLEDLQAKSKK